MVPTLIAIAIKGINFYGTEADFALAKRVFPPDFWVLSLFDNILQMSGQMKHHLRTCEVIYFDIFYIYGKLYDES